MNPTFSHVKSYMTLQKEVLDKASHFAATWLEVVYRTPNLDYSLKKPTSQAGRQLYLEQEQSTLTANIKALSQTHGLFFFFAGSCSWCHHFAPIVKRFGEQYGLQILAISLDGGRLKEFQTPIFLAQNDNGIAEKLGVKALPALMALDPDDTRRVWFILDELPALGKLPSLSTLLAEGRKYGGCMVAGLQSIPQLGAIYGQARAQSLLDLFNTKIFFRNTDPTTTSWVSKVLGEEEREENTESLSYGANTMRDGINLNSIKRIRPLVLPTELSTLGPLEAYLSFPGNFPITKLQMEYKNPKAMEEAFCLR